MRGKGLFNEETDLGIPDCHKVRFRTAAQRNNNPEDAAKEMADALAWLRNPASHDDAGVNAMYQKIDSMLPRRKEQSKQECAHEMLNALNWMRKGKEKARGRISKTSLPFTQKERPNT